MEVVKIQVFSWLFDAQLVIGDQTLLWREIIGNVFGLLSALGGMRRKVWAWPIGIFGNLLLLTVFLGTVFQTPNPVNLLGQAGRQIMFISVSIYGWIRWKEKKTQAVTATDTAGSKISKEEGFTPGWASAKQRLGLVACLVGGTLILTPVFSALGSYEPVWADAWIFTGSVLATYGMARKWVEFWLIWIAVDIVGVPLLWGAGYYASAVMYLFYGAFTLTGFFVWLRVRKRHRDLAKIVPIIPQHPRQ